VDRIRDPDFNCLPLSIRARRHIPSSEAKSYRVYIFGTFTGGKCTDLCPGWTHRASGRLLSVKSLRPDVNARDKR